MVIEQRGGRHGIMSRPELPLAVASPILSSELLSDLLAVQDLHPKISDDIWRHVGIACEQVKGKHDIWLRLWSTLVQGDQPMTTHVQSASQR